ncbi:DUF6163 family protein [Liberibacter crescens]|nr:DUF6163 family protein [Liberibacter crescens]AMC13069.1 hypothetical protein RL73_05540 [Liberibacter crescens]
MSTLQLTRIEMIFIFFLRIVSIISFIFTLYYWKMAVGYSFEGYRRFDLLPTPWKTAVASLSVLFPVSSVGLWLTVSWGPVIWLLSAVIQIIMYLIFPNIFGYNYVLCLMHLLILVLYLSMRFLLAHQKSN